MLDVEWRMLSRFLGLLNHVQLSKINPVADGNHKHLNFEERWNKTNHILLAESEAWLKDGKYKIPNGQYLEELSKRIVPESLKDIDVSLGSRAGFLDVTHQATASSNPLKELTRVWQVVISMGNYVSINKWAKNLREPDRKVQFCVKGEKGKQMVVQEEPRPRRKKA